MKEKKLRKLLKEKKMIVAPVIHDAVEARIAEMVGFEAVYVSGGSTSVGWGGMPDINLLTLNEMVLNAKFVADAVKAPVIADADTGYGNAINVMRTVREFIRADVDAIHIEDQIWSKRCGYVAGKLLISKEEAVGKYRAASDARDEEDSNFLIIARCDARGALGGGVDEAIERGNAYADAGVDMIYVEAPQSQEEVKRYVKEIRAPLLYPMCLPPASHLFNLNELGQLGIAVTIVQGVWWVVTKGVWDYLVDLKKRGAQAFWDVLDEVKGHPMEDYFATVPYSGVRKLEEKYFPKELLKRYKKKTTGFQY